MSLSRASLAAIVAGLVLLTAGALLIPADKTLGPATRWVFVHGAVTWTGILTTLGAGTDGAVLASVPRTGSGRGPDRVGLWRLVSIALLFWAASLGLGFPVMKMSWGGVLWNEPRLLMSMEIVFLLLLVWVVGLVVENRRVLAFAALAAAAAMVALLLMTSGAFHPDNPIFGSGSPRFIISFVALLVGMLAVATGVVFRAAVERRLTVYVGEDQVRVARERYGVPRDVAVEQEILPWEMDLIERVCGDTRFHDVTIFILRGEEMALIHKPSEPPGAFWAPTGGLSPGGGAGGCRPARGLGRDRTAGGTLALRVADAGPLHLRVSSPAVDLPRLPGGSRLGRAGSGGHRRGGVGRLGFLRRLPGTSSAGTAGQRLGSFPLPAEDQRVSV